MSKDTLKVASRKDFTTWSEEASADEVKLGSLQRIADACELMAQDRSKMLLEMDRLKSGRDYWMKEAECVARKVSALRGYITRLKRGGK